MISPTKSIRLVSGQKLASPQKRRKKTAKYVFLSLTQRKGKWSYEQKYDDISRVVIPVGVHGGPGFAFVWCEVGTEHIWKQKLFDHVDSALRKQRRAIDKSIKTLDAFKTKEKV